MSGLKEYQIVCNYGMWGEILTNIKDAQKDLDYCRKEYNDRDAFHIEERDVSAWREYREGDEGG